MPKEKRWVFTAKRKEALKTAQEEHVALVELGLKARGTRSSAKRVRVARKVK